MKKIIIASLALLIAGCGPSEEEIRAKIEAEQKAAAEVKAKEEEAKNNVARDLMLRKIELAKKACKIVGEYAECRYYLKGNYHSFYIWAYGDATFSRIFNEVVLDNFDLPPQIVSKMESTTPAMELKEASMPRANVSWDFSVGRCDKYECEKSGKFNIEII